MSGEKVVINQQTGGAKGQKIIQMSLVPIEEMWEVAKLYALGARKYAPHNWRKGYDWSLSYDACMRHLQAFWNGETEHEVIEGDPDTKVHHLASVIFHALALMFFQKHHPQLDDRPVTVQKSWRSGGVISESFLPVVQQDIPGYIQQVQRLNQEDNKYPIKARD